MKAKPLTRPKGYLEIVIDGQIIFYKIGTTHVNFRWSDRSMSLTAQLAGQIFPTMTADDIEYDHWHGGFSVTPGDITKYLRSEVL